MKHTLRNLRGILTTAIGQRIGTITHVATQDPVAALTFDDGPHPEFTPRLLEILRRHKARATFFMIGEAAGYQTDLVRRIAEDGHTIGNHSRNHQALPLLSTRKRYVEIRSCQKILSPYGEKLFRPPYGHQSPATHLQTLLLGYKVVAWNVAAVDWLDHDAEHTAGLLLQRIRPGSIVLLHDRLHTSLGKRHVDRKTTLEAVDIVLTQLKNQFEFIPLPEMFKRGRPVRENWYWKPDMDFLNRLTPESEQTQTFTPNKV